MRGWLTIRRTFRAFCTEQGKTALLAQWDIERNLPLTPDDVTFGSHKESGGPVKRPLMAGHGLHPQRGCKLPYCTGRKVTPKQGGLVKQFPALAAEWDDEKNAPLTPQDVTTGSHKLIWWRCPKGHSWRAAVYSRTTSARAVRSAPDGRRSQAKTTSRRCTRTLPRSGTRRKTVRSDRAASPRVQTAACGGDAKRGTPTVL